MKYDEPMAAGIFLPDNLMPSQHRDMHSGAAQDPCRRLILAILSDAIDCLTKGRHDRSTCRYCRYYAERRVSTTCRRSRLYWDAYDWVFDGGGVVTFDYACEVLDIDPTYLRNGIRAFNGKIGRRAPTLDYLHPKS